jgi:NAD(P)-dependent dehydrogenase (short-subunit alcohol dehydrogenase family)
MTNKDLLGRRYAVTGASSGLGLHVAKALSERGASLVVFGRSAERLAAAEFTDALMVTMPDQSTPSQWRAALITSTASGRIDGLIHCAGGVVIAPMRLTPDRLYEEAMATVDIALGVMGAAASAGVLADGGSVVLMSSVAAHRGAPAMSAYAGGKMAVEAIARVAAIELAPRRIRVNCVAAGAFESPMHDRVTGPMTQAMRDEYASSHPLGVGKIEDVAAAVLFLLSDQARWITGTTMVVDGGYLAR